MSQVQPETSSPEQQLVQRAKGAASYGAEQAAKLAGLKLGTLAQAVRQTGEELRAQGKERESRIADELAKRTQRFSGSMSGSDGTQILNALGRVKEELPRQRARARSELSTRVTSQANARTTQAAQATRSIAGAMRTTSEQLRAQNEETSALVLAVGAGQFERLGGYLARSDAEQLRADAARVAGQVRNTTARAKDTVAEKTQGVVSTGKRAVGRTPTVMRRKPMWIVAGAIAGGLIANRRLAKQRPVLRDGREAAGERAMLENLSKTELQERAERAGIASGAQTKKELIEALVSVDITTSA